MARAPQAKGWGHLCQWCGGPHCSFTSKIIRMSPLYMSHIHPYTSMYSIIPYPHALIDGMTGPRPSWSWKRRWDRARQRHTKHMSQMRGHSVETLQESLSDLSILETNLVPRKNASIRESPKASAKEQTQASMQKFLMNFNCQKQIEHVVFNHIFQAFVRESCVNQTSWA